MAAAEDKHESIDTIVDIEPAPDSSVRAIHASAIETPLPPGVRVLPIAIRVSAALLGASSSAYVTLTTEEGEVLFEGCTDDGGSLDIVVLVDMDTSRVHALVEAGSKYRNAVIAVRTPSEGATEHTFT